MFFARAIRDKNKHLKDLKLSSNMRKFESNKSKNSHLSVNVDLLVGMNEVDSNMTVWLKLATTTITSLAK